MSIPQKEYERFWEMPEASVRLDNMALRRLASIEERSANSVRYYHDELERRAACPSPIPSLPRNDSRIWRAVLRRTGRFVEPQRRGGTWPV